MHTSYTPDTLLSLLRSMQKMKKKKSRAFIPHLIPIGRLAATKHDRFYIVCVASFDGMPNDFHASVSYFCCSLLILYFIIDVIAKWMVDGGELERVRLYTPNRRYLPLLFSDSFAFEFHFSGCYYYYCCCTLCWTSNGIRFTILVTTSTPVSPVIRL